MFLSLKAFLCKNVLNLVISELSPCLFLKSPREMKVALILQCNSDAKLIFNLYLF